MKILFKDLKHKKIKLMIDNEDDLWHLEKILEKGDFVKSRTSRKIDIGDSGNSDRKTVILKIDVEKVEFHDFGKILRIHGKIIEGPENVPKTYHTINIEQESVLSIEKKEWKN